MNYRIEVLFAAAFSVLLNVDGFIVLANPGFLAIGGNNYLLAILYFGIAIFGLILNQRFSRVATKSFISIYFIVFAFITLMLLGIQGFVFVESGEKLKALRDAFYILSFFVFGLYFQNCLFTSRARIYAFVATLTVLNIVVFPGLAFVLQIASTIEGRFAGMQISPSVFGMSAAAIAITWAHVAPSGWRKTAIIVLSLILIVLSGTRVALLIAVSYFIANQLGFWSETKRSGLMRGGAISIVTLLAFGTLLVQSIESGSARIVSVEDAEGGSISTRLYWYENIVSSLSEKEYFKASGAGAAENLIGFITHLDPLRFWFDYGFVFLVVFIAYLIMYAKVAGCSRWIVHAYVLFIFLLYSTHNVFQAPGLLFLYALLIAALGRPKEAGVGLAWVVSGIETIGPVQSRVGVKWTPKIGQRYKVESGRIMRISEDGQTT